MALFLVGRPSTWVEVHQGTKIATNIMLKGSIECELHFTPVGEARSKNVARDVRSWGKIFPHYPCFYPEDTGDPKPSGNWEVRHFQELERSLNRGPVETCLANSTPISGGPRLLLDSRASHEEEVSWFVAGKHEDEPAVNGILVSVFPRRELANSNSEPYWEGGAGKCSCSLDQFIHHCTVWWKG